MDVTEACVVCRIRASTRLCDYPLALRADRPEYDFHTCDAPLCEVCAREVRVTFLHDDTWDFCPVHDDDRLPLASKRMVIGPIYESQADHEEVDALRRVVWRGCRSVDAERTARLERIGVVA